MRTGSWKLQWLGVAVLVAVVLAAIGIAQTAAGRSLLRKTGLTSSPARYTELAFEKPMLLPEKFPHGRFKVHAPFAIHNVGGARHTYRWTVEEVAGGQSTRVAGGQITLEPGVRRSANPGMWLRCTRTGRVRVQVRLSDPAESVGWWANCLPGPGGGGG